MEKQKVLDRIKSSMMVLVGIGTEISEKHHTREEDAWNSSYGAYKNGVHFNHYHAYTSQPSLNAIGEEIKAGHACYGTPLIVINGLVI